MGDRYRIIYEEGQGEIEEKKSRFICRVRPVKTEEEAMAFITEIKKMCWNARHNCFAYVLGKNQEFVRCSDDGEPQGTAGRPMLDVLLKEDIHDAVAVVTRYFGGILLGTGGLVRAYQEAVKSGLEGSIIVEKTAGIKGEISTDYSSIGKVQYLMRIEGAIELNTEFAEKVTVTFLTKQEEFQGFCDKITEATGGRSRTKKLSEVWYGDALGECVVFDE